MKDRHLFTRVTLSNFSFPPQQQGNFSMAGLTLSAVAKCHALQICIVEFALFKIGLPLGALCARLCEGRLKSFIFFSRNSLVQWHSIQFEPFGNQLLLSILNVSCFVYLVVYFSFWTKGSTLGILRGRFPFVRTGRPAGRTIAEPLPNQSVSKWNLLFPKVFAEKTSPSCILFGTWLIGQKWNCYYDGNALAGQFWQIESSLGNC